MLRLLIAAPLELLPLLCGIVSDGRSKDRDAASAAGLLVGLVARGFRLMVAMAGTGGISMCNGVLSLRRVCVCFGGEGRPRIGDSTISSSGSVTSATECRFV